MNEKDIYYIALAKYMNVHKLTEEYEVFPINIFVAPLDTKIKILVEALNNNVLVEQVDDYIKYMEGISMTKSGIR